MAGSASMRKSQALRTNRKYEGGERLSQSVDTVNRSAVVLASAFKRIKNRARKLAQNLHCLRDLRQTRKC